MPELPEVETIVRSLRPQVLRRRITGVEFCQRGSNGSRLGKTLDILSNPAGRFRRRICGAVIEGVERYGKNIVFRLRHPGGGGRGVSLWIHLGMTGRLTCENTPESLGKHTHLVFCLDDPGRWLHYSDIRRFGRLRLTAGDDRESAGLGPDPLEISFEEFFLRLRSRRAMLKSLLLDQRFLRGLGNIYADESLFRAGIHPETPAARLRRQQALRLYEAIRETLWLAIEHCGSSISNYVDGWGRPGNFQRLLQVYRRTGQPCLRCGSGIQRIWIASRSTHFCPRCQRRNVRDRLPGHSFRRAKGGQ